MSHKTVNRKTSPKTRKRELCIKSLPHALKSGRRLGSTTVKPSAKWQSDMNRVMSNLTKLTCCEILWWAQLWWSCLIRSHTNKVVVHYRNLTIQFWPSKPILCWHRTESANIGPKPIVSWRALRAFVKWAVKAELERANLICCPMFMITVRWPMREGVWNCIPLNTYMQAYFSFKTLSKFYIFTFCRLCSEAYIGNLKCWSMFGGIESWPLD